MRGTAALFKPHRLPQKEPIEFQAILPLRLKNKISGKGEKTSDVACLHEMSILFACLKEHEFNQAVCSKEITQFKSCYKSFLDDKRVKKEQEEKGIVATGQKNLSHKQVNQVLRKYPAIFKK